MSHDSFKAAVTPLLAELEASANAHDTDRHMAAYARDPALTFVFNGVIVRGWDQLRELQRQWWSDGKATGSYRYVGDPMVELVGEDAGITTILIAATREAEDGTIIAKQLAYSAVWRKRPEGWRITFAHESSGQ